MNPGWLTAETAKPRAQEIIHQVYKEVEAKGHGVTTSLRAEAMNAASSNQQRRAILRTFFESSIGILDGTDKETWYITEGRIGPQFAHFGIVNWTSWIGDIVTRVRNAILDGDFPDRLLYGPQGRQSVSWVGPLVEYAVQNGQIHECDFKFGPSTTAESKPIEVEPVATVPQYGLRSIVRTLDMAQNDRIRGPVSDIYILMGGPGTGKTTVALHRIPFLIDFHSDPQATIPVGTPKVTEDTTLVVVWEPHLAPYLRSCLDALGLNRIPPANVALVRDWIFTQLRAQIVFGPQAYRLLPSESPSVAQSKLSLTEALLVSFLESGPSLADALSSELNGFVQDVQSLQNEIVDKIPSLAKTWVNPGDKRETKLNHRNVQRRLISLANELEKRRATFANAGQMIDRVKSLQAIIRGARIVAVLKAFYSSEQVSSQVETAFGAECLLEFRQSLARQERDHSLSDGDGFLVLWLIDLPQTGKLLDERIAPLPRYAHIMIDEAQYYEPIVLRLLARLCDVPKGTMTIVGDLEQRVTSTGGLVSWGAAGISVKPENINVLEINYRWSEPVFRFLSIFQSASGIEGDLKPPRKWYSTSGQVPKIYTFESRDEELGRVVKEIGKLRHSPQGTLWTIAVIVPDSYHADAQRIVIDALNGYAIAATWAVGDQVRDSVHKVVVTKYNNVVGLEFNAVFVVGVNEVVRTLSKPELSSVWVALSRAHQFLFVSRVNGDPIFSKKEFAKYRE